MARFTVDTHLFRELGELLVGRDSTALVELIKNAYDADATEVIVSGINLSDPERGVITVSDDGNGMRPRLFERGFLRIASRTKEHGLRRSRRFGRRFTGAKGVGRLAAHKLARNLQLRSVAWRPSSTSCHLGVDASIDWDIVESYETLDELADSAAINVRPFLADSPAPSGTKITLRRLRRSWTPEERERFMTEVQTFAPPTVLSEPLPSTAVADPLLFTKPLIRDVTGADPGWRVRLEGEFEPGESYWQALAASAAWLLEIDCRTDPGVVRYCITPNRKTQARLSNANTERFELPHPNPNVGPFFQARILIRKGGRWDKHSNGPRIYMEGFRVLPYGEPRNDWLGLDTDYTARSTLTRLKGKAWASVVGPPRAREGLYFLPARNYFGAVFLTQTAAPSLRMLVNREGFVPDSAFETLVELLRTGIDLSTRVRAAVEESVESEPLVLGKLQSSQPIDRRDIIAPIFQAEAEFRRSVDHVQALARTARVELAHGDIVSAKQHLASLATASEVITAGSEHLIRERMMVRVLASVGLQLASFIHEIRALLGMAETLEAALGRIREDPTVSPGVRKSLARIQGDAGDLKRSLERQASYLTDIVTPDSRRRRSQQRISERFDAARRLVELASIREDITIENAISSELRTPRPMFAAELTTVFSNLLTNAVKAAGRKGRIMAEGWEREGEVHILIANTGQKVDLQEAERWFRPFESTTTGVDPVLGQGMGLGLPITRSVLEEYGGEIKFVKPPQGYATATEIVFPRSS